MRPLNIGTSLVLEAPTRMVIDLAPSTVAVNLIALDTRLVILGSIDGQYQFSGQSTNVRLARKTWIRLTLAGFGRDQLEPTQRHEV